ncbi:hypothetical protein AS026_32980 [Rhizobium altiplani]|uniref:Uncharacterized protein n=1 Tax=Rhizobium altiplani TaxID=1864509 RepID=A0A109JX02_9HYPH|nr:type IV toxin-antitoxin system AbiEi family antitoxin domain-containing protein [Rhizobium altiplani]KWV56666.1 hypothetical protein AS026_32980 [Rhizobium altiplani]
MIAEWRSSLSPRRLNLLQKDCRSIKVKRLFFWFADRHSPSWLRQIDRKGVDLGSGKRMLLKRGRLDPTLSDHRAGGTQSLCLKRQTYTVFQSCRVGQAGVEHRVGSAPDLIWIPHE